MQAYGDVSGHFRGLIQGDCEVVVVGVVIGDRVAAGRCPKKTVRNVDDIPEAKWNDLTRVQKRRLFDCFSENDQLKFGFARFTRDQLHTLENHYLLHQNVKFPPDWDLALTGYAYGEILFEWDANNNNRVIFEFDRVASKDQSEDIADHIKTFVPSINPYIEGSRQSSGIQAADCFAGAAAEDYMRGTDWLDMIGRNRIKTASTGAVVQLEYRLSERS